jgi:carboxypeptidase Taq
VHAWGAALTPTEIMQQATGKATDAKWHVAHLRERYVG